MGEVNRNRNKSLGFPVARDEQPDFEYLKTSVWLYKFHIKR